MSLPLRATEPEPEPSPELLAELEAGGWMYEWELTPDLSTPPLGPNLASVHRTRCEMIEPVVRDALAAAGPQARALDLACNEGWFSHRLLEWGAAEVLGIDARQENIHRATLLRDHFRIGEPQLRLLTADVFDLDASNLGTFDVVLVLGLVYHLEQPLEAVRIARSLTRRLCVLESQLTRQNEPIVRGDGVPDLLHA